MSPTTKNQLQDTASDFVYDSAGNLTQPGPTGGTYVFDAENHLTSAGGVTYTYDGDGNRVMKSNGTIYWYGANSASLEESDLSGNLLRYYYYFDGQRVARQLPTNEVGFYMTDHLGSVRYLGGSSTGYSLDYYPFGGVITNIDVGDDRYQFTGKERDAESGLDNFGARFDSSQWGRFMSPDDFTKDSDVHDPGSWNKYAYARNNPLRYVDPTGEEATVSNTGCSTSSNGQQTCNLSVTATIAIYSVNGTTDAQLKQAQSAITSQIDKAWTGSFTQDGVTYNVTTNVTVSLAGSADAAFHSGAQNAVGIDASSTATSHVDAGPRGSGQDRGVWDFVSITSGGLAPHEFSHVIGLDDNHGNVLSNAFSMAAIGNLGPHATVLDFQWAFGPELRQGQKNFDVGVREGRVCPFCNNRGNRHWWEVLPQQTQH
jgi:RHS repeat-associated protein